MPFADRDSRRPRGLETGCARPPLLSRLRALRRREAGPLSFRRLHTLRGPQRSIVRIWTSILRSCRSTVVTRSDSRTACLEIFRSKRRSHSATRREYRHAWPPLRNVRRKQRRLGGGAKHARWPFSCGARRFVGTQHSLSAQRRVTVLRRLKPSNTDRED